MRDDVAWFNMVSHWLGISVVDIQACRDIWGDVSYQTQGQQMFRTWLFFPTSALFHSMAPGDAAGFQRYHFQTLYIESYMEQFLWNWPQLNANGPEPMVTQIYVSLWHHKATLHGLAPGSSFTAFTKLGAKSLSKGVLNCFHLEPWAQWKLNQTADNICQESAHQFDISSHCPCLLDPQHSTGMYYWGGFLAEMEFLASQDHKMIPFNNPSWQVELDIGALWPDPTRGSWKAWCCVVEWTCAVLCDHNSAQVLSVMIEMYRAC